MSLANVKRLLGATAILAALAIGMSALLAADEPKESTHARQRSDEVEAALKERLAVLVELQKLTPQAYQNGEASFDEVLAAERDVLSAKLELAATPDERIATLEQMLENAQRLEELTGQLAQVQEASRTDALRAKAHRLRVQADLLQAGSTKK